ncbi:MAG: hypothetical protein ACC655_11700, partial [Rhodothermia bacterium]
ELPGMRFRTVSFLVGNRMHGNMSRKYQIEPLLILLIAASGCASSGSGRSSGGRSDYAVPMTSRQTELRKRYKKLLGL